MKIDRLQSYFISVSPRRRKYRSIGFSLYIEGNSCYLKKDTEIELPV